MDQHPSFSLSSLFPYTIFPYLILILGSSFNNKVAAILDSKIVCTWKLAETAANARALVEVVEEFHQQ